MSDPVSAERRIRPGLCSVTLRALEPAAVVDLAAGAGLEGIEWGADVHVPPGDEAAARSAADRTREAGLACPSYGSYLRAGAAEPGDVDPVLATAQALGSPTVRVWCDWLAVVDADDARRADMARDLTRWCERAEPLGIDLALEFHAFTLTETAESTLRLLRDVGAPNLFTYWQPMDGVAVPALIDELDAVLDDLAHLHVFRWAADGARLPLGDGRDLWPQVLAAASAPGRWRRERWAHLEFVRGDEPGQLVADAAVLRGWLGG